MAKKLWIVSLSVAAHVGVFTGAYLTNAWRLDRLAVAKQSISLAVMMPPPAPSGGPTPGQKPVDPVAPAKKVAREPVQPTEVKHADAPVPLVDDGGGGQGSAQGPGTNPDGEPTDTGTCTGPACGPATAPPAKEPSVVVAPPLVQTIAPPMMKGLRIKGDTAIAPPDVVKTQMMRDDHRRSVGSFKICIAESGAVSQVSVVASTKYPAYDQKLMAAMRAWEYRPYLVGGRAVPVCSAVSFVFTME